MGGAGGRPGGGRGGGGGRGAGARPRGGAGGRGGGGGGALRLGRVLGEVEIMVGGVRNHVRCVISEINRLFFS